MTAYSIHPRPPDLQSASYNGDAPGPELELLRDGKGAIYAALGYVVQAKRSLVALIAAVALTSP